MWGAGAVRRFIYLFLLRSIPELGCPEAPMTREGAPAMSPESQASASILAIRTLESKLLPLLGSDWGPNVRS